MEIYVAWKKSTDEGYPRRRVIEITTPVVGETTPLEDAILSTPGICQGSIKCKGSPAILSTYAEPQVLEALVVPPTDEQCIVAIRLALKAAQEKMVEKKGLYEKIEAKRDTEVVVAATTFLEGNVLFPACDTTKKSRLFRTNPELAAQVVQKLRRLDDEKAAAREAAAEVREAESALREEKRSAEKEARQAEKLAWIEKYGLPRLKVQIEASLTGWPLYLHERLRKDLGPEWELDNNGDGQGVFNPSEEAVATLSATADQLVEKELMPSRAEALAHLSIQKMVFFTDPEDDEDDEVNEEGIFVVFDEYRPGQHPSWPVKSVRIEVDEK